ncbi:MAG TPA: hypothetical protein ENK22_10435 [Persephonella sp.]|nr:hypothetical protein [Persephonella sp.]
MREIERIYLAYLDEVENPIEEIREEKFTYKLDKSQKEKIKRMFTKINIEPEKKSEIHKGNIYLMFEDYIPIYYLIYDQIDDLYEVLKMSDWVELGNENDLLTKINDEWFIVETWNNFYLTADQINRSIFYGKIPKEDFDLVRKFLNGEIKELPREKRGLKAGEGSYQMKFHEKESEIVRKYKLLPFEQLPELENTIKLPPKREILLELVAGKEKTTAFGENFVLHKDLENNRIELILPKELQGKKGIITVLDQTYQIDHIPEKIYLKPTEEIKKIDVEKLAQKISVRETK